MKRVSPKNASFNELCAMKRDHVDVGDFSIMTDSRVVWLSEQKIGEDQTQHIEIPRGKFNRLLAWYLGSWGGKRPRKVRRNSI